MNCGDCYQHTKTKIQLKKHRKEEVKEPLSPDRKRKISYFLRTTDLIGRDLYFVDILCQQL